MIIFWSQETVFFCRLLNQHPRAFYSKTPRRELMTVAISGIKRPNILEMAIFHCLYERGVPFFRLATSSQFPRAVHQLGDTYTLAAGLPSLYTLCCSITYATRSSLAFSRFISRMPQLPLQSCQRILLLRGRPSISLSQRFTAFPLGPSRSGAENFTF